MQIVLLENQQLVDFCEHQRSEAEIINVSGLSTWQRYTLLLRLLKSVPPQTPHSEQERNHFAKASVRNAEQAARMRKLRAKEQRSKENDHGLD